MLKWKHTLQQEILSKIMWTRIIWQPLINLIIIHSSAYYCADTLKTDVGEKHVPSKMKKGKKNK